MYFLLCLVILLKEKGGMKMNHMPLLKACFKAGVHFIRNMTIQQAATIAGIIFLIIHPEVLSPIWLTLATSVLILLLL
jgi:hypothetical protein